MKLSITLKINTLYIPLKLIFGHTSASLSSLILFSYFIAPGPRWNGGGSIAAPFAGISHEIRYRLNVH